MAVADTTKPVLTSLTFPSILDVTTGGRNMSFTVGATDEGLGVESVSIRFKTSWQGSSGTADNYVFLGQSWGDSFADGSSTVSEFISSASGSGTYDIDFVNVSDKAGNSRLYYASELAGLGFRTSFSIVDNNVTPVTTATINAPTSVAEDIDTSIALSITLANVSQASGTVSMSFATAQSTVTNGSDVSVPVYSGSYSVTQSPVGNYTLALPSISIIKDQVAEGTETVAVTIRASGQIFDTGTDTKTVTIKLIDSGQTGTAGADTLTGTRFADDISGRDGNDVLRGGAGNDRIDGGAGFDKAVFAGTYQQSRITVTANVVTVTGPDGTDTVTGVEQFAFIDGMFTIDSRSTGAQVTRMYDTVLGRAPDAVGLDYWVDQIDHGSMSLSGVAGALAASAEFQTATGGLSNGRFVDYVYGHALGRGADKGGLDYWTARLDAGLSRGELLVQFSESSEHQAKTALTVSRGYFHSDDTAQAIALLYDSFTGRLPDADGLGYWIDQVKSGARTLGQVASGFAASAEFAGATRGMTNGQLVDFMYQNTLDRGPDAGGRAYWTDQLDRGLSKGDLLLAFSQSDEHASLMAPYIIGGIDII